MVGPARKREAVRHVGEVLEVSERRACGVTEQPRATQRYRGRKRGKDAALAADLGSEPGAPALAASWNWRSSASLTNVGVRRRQ